MEKSKIAPNAAPKKVTVATDDLDLFNKNNAPSHPKGSMKQKIHDKIETARKKHYGTTVTDSIPTAVKIHPVHKLFDSVINEMIPMGANEKELEKSLEDFVSATPIKKEQKKTLRDIRTSHPKVANSNYSEPHEKLKDRDFEPVRKRAIMAEMASEPELDVIESLMEAVGSPNTNRTDNVASQKGASRVVISSDNDSEKTALKKPNIGNSQAYKKADYSKANYSVLTKDDSTNIGGYSPDAAPDIGSIQGAFQHQSHPYGVDNAGFRKNLGRSDPTSNYKAAVVKQAASPINTTKPDADKKKDVVKDDNQQ